MKTGNFGVYLGVRTCELFLCFVAIVRVRAIMLTSLFSLFYVTGEFHRFLHRDRAKLRRRIAVNSNGAAATQNCKHDSVYLENLNGTVGSRMVFP